MTFLNARRLPVIAGLFCLVFVAFAGASYGTVTFNAIPSPTEVINTGRAEVTGSINLSVTGSGPHLTGTSTGGCTQIGIVYTNPAMQIDNTETSGIRLFFSAGFTSAFTASVCSEVGILSVENRDINGRCSGFITLSMEPGAAPTATAGDFIRLEGVRGRIDASLAITPGTDLFADLQSINDPAANQFVPDRIRVAKSLDGMNVSVVSASVLLCFPPLGTAPPGGAPGYSITITEGFARAFFDDDSGAGGGDLSTDRVDSGDQAGIFEIPGGGSVPVGGTGTEPGARSIGAATNSTRFSVWLEDIPASVTSISWDASVMTGVGTGATLVLVSDSFSSSSGTSSAIYEFITPDQTGVSDISVESFVLTPEVNIATGSTATGIIMAAVTLAPDSTAATGCGSPSGTPSRPRFLSMMESDSVATNNPPDDPHAPYASVIRCNCYLLFTYVTATDSFNTGIAIANTTGDTAVFGAVLEAPDQLGTITFYFYDVTAGFVGSTTTTSTFGAGASFVGLVTELLPAGITSFSGYIIAKTEFQYCHGFAFVADSVFASIAHGYIGNVIPDPVIKSITTPAFRPAADSADGSGVPQGESLRN